MTLTYTIQSLGLLRTSDQPDAENSTWQHNSHERQTAMPAAGFDPQSQHKRVAADPRCRPCCHWHRPYYYITASICTKAAISFILSYIA